MKASLPGKWNTMSANSFLPASYKRAAQVSAFKYFLIGL